MRGAGIRKSLLRFGRGTDGAAALEFALVAPLLFALLFGIIVFGYAFALQNSLQELTADAARATVGGLSTTERQSLLDSYMAQASSQYVLLDASKLTYAATFTDGTAASIALNVNYDLTGSVVALLDSTLNMSMTTLSGSAYLVY
ncbi:MAG: pilus assembly protein [Rhodobacteraceae bacterium]|nr:pilus assembly protein [Paracoccaceae bacterium]